MVIEDPEGGAGVGVDEGEQAVAGFVIVLGTFGEAFEQLALVEGEVGAVAEGGEVFNADAVAVEVFEGQIDAAALGVFADVAKDVGELEGEAGFFGELFGARDRCSRRCGCRRGRRRRRRSSSSGGDRRRWRRC